MMRSPEQQFNFAKRLPVQELARVLQGQSDVVDMSIAEMVLRQKMQMQKAQQGAAAVPMAQGPKVVERDLAQAGVAAMPAPNLENVDSYAGGGIVAFDDGGEVVRAFDGLYIGGGKGPQLPRPTEEEMEARRLRDQLRRFYQGSVFEFRPSFGGNIAAEREEYKTKRATADTILNNLDKLDIESLRNLAAEARTTAKPAATPAMTTTPTAINAPEITLGDLRKLEKGEGAPSVPATAPPKPPGASAVEKEEAGLSSLIDKFYGPARTAESLQDITQKRLALYKQLGVEAEPYEKAIKKLEEQKAADVEARREAGWGRLLEAGLGIMGGTSPYALTNIGQGAQAAAKGAMEDIKDFRKLERERQKAITDYNLAANAYKKSGADADLATAERERTRVDTLNMKRADAGLTVAVEQIKLKAQRESKLDERDLKLYLGALEQAGNMLKNNFDVSSMPLDEIQAKVSAQAARIYNQYKTGNFGAGVSTGIDASQWGTPRIK